MKIIEGKKADAQEWVMRGFAITISVLLATMLIVQISMKV